MSLKTHHCSLSASMISFSSSGLTPIRAGADWILIKTLKFATSLQWEVKKLGTGQCKRSKTHTYWRFVLQLCKQSMVISKARLVYQKIFFFENPLWGWKVMLVMYVASLHIRITVVCLHTLMLSTKRRARAVLNVMCKWHCIPLLTLLQLTVALLLDLNFIARMMVWLGICWWWSSRKYHADDDACCTLFVALLFL